ncbi:MAG: hypothetical protein ACI4UL_06230 [Muribaculaceae bacterium]
MKRICCLVALMASSAILSAQQSDEYGFSSIVEPFRWAENTPEGCPFKPSKAFSEVVFTGRFANYTNADTWYPSWADDDCLYSPWTDGYLLNDSLDHYYPYRYPDPEHSCYSLHRNDLSGKHRNPSTAQAKIVGDDPMNLQVIDLKPEIEGDPAPYGGRYPCGSLVHNGVWYYGTYCLTNRGDSNCNGVGWTQFGPFVGFRISTDYGKTWTDSPCTPSQPLFGENPAVAPVKIGAPHFVDFGKNMQYSPDGYAYLVAHGASTKEAWNGWIQGDEIYLIRVRPSIENINNPKTYEFYGGTDKKGRPVWTKEFSEIRPLLKWDGRLGCVTITYNPGIKKYLMCITRGYRNLPWDNGRYDTMILESSHIDRDWRLLKYLDRFGPVAYFVNIPSKFISPDGKTMWLCYSANWHNKHAGGAPYGSHYSMSLHEFTIE